MYASGNFHHIYEIQPNKYKFYVWIQDRLEQVLLLQVSTDISLTFSTLLKKLSCKPICNYKSDQRMLLCYISWYTENLDKLWQKENKIQCSTLTSSNAQSVEENGFLCILEAPSSHLFHLQSHTGSMQPYPLQISSVEQDTSLDLQELCPLWMGYSLWSSQAIVYPTYSWRHHIVLSFLPIKNQLVGFYVQTSGHGSCIYISISAIVTKLQQIIHDTVLNTNSNNVCPVIFGLQPEGWKVWDQSQVDFQSQGSEQLHSAKGEGERF